MAEKINLDAQDLAKDVKVTVKIRKLNQFRFRLWLAEKIVRLGMVLSWINYDIVEQHPLEHAIEWFGEQGIVISIAYGPMKGEGKSNGNQWSVQLLNDRTGEIFELPYQANSFTHCIEIAKIEADKRGWVKRT